MVLFYLSVVMKAYHPHETDWAGTLKGKALAPFPARAAAFVIDFTLAFFLFSGLLIAGSKVLGAMDALDTDKHVNLKFNFSNWYSIVFIVFYFGLFTYFGKGKTPGKWLLGIRVVSLLHERISLWHSIERALGYGASALEFGFGFVQYFIHPNRQTVHDRIAETIVVYDRRKKQERKEMVEETAEENPGEETPVDEPALQEKPVE